MISTTDRMGGFISAQIINVRDIASFQVQNGRVTLSMKEDTNALSLDIVKNGVQAQVISTMIKSGELFSIDIEIECQNDEKFNYMAFNKYLALLKDATGVIHVLGTPEFPLTLISNPNFGRLASDRTSRTIKLSGKQPHDVLIM